jgi:hypothetical protein
VTILVMGAMAAVLFSPAVRHLGLPLKILVVQFSFKAAKHAAVLEEALKWFLGEAPIPGAVPSKSRHRRRRAEA